MHIYFLLLLSLISPLYSSCIEIQDFPELMIQKSRQKDFILYVGLDACIPCQNVKTVLKDVEDKKIYAIDLKKIPKARHLLNIDTVPSLIIFNHGDIEQVITGEKNITRYFSNTPR